MPDTEKLLKEILYRSLTKGKNDFKKFYEEFNDKDIIKKELDEANRLFKKFSLNKKNSEEFSEVFDTLKNLIGDTKIFAYGFYHNGDKTPLCIGCTGNSVTRLKQHFQWYSSAFIKFPMYFLDEIRVWRSDALTKQNIKRFEDFLLEKFTPYFNKKRSEKYLEEEIELYQKVKYKSISVSEHRELFKMFS